jgi:hypothetical protein
MVDNHIDWNMYVTQLEITAKEKPLLREGIYFNECEKKQHPKKDAQ